MNALESLATQTTGEIAGGSIFAFAFLALGVLFSIACFGFWLWMLIDALTKEPTEDNQRLLWALIIILAPFIGALLYFFLRKLGRKSSA